jgi:hypothetical protein
MLPCFACCSLVAGASRATLLRPRPAKPREPLAGCTPGAGGLGGSGAVAGPGSHAAVMLTRSRAGVFVGSPGAVSGMDVGAGADDDDEDYHVEDDAPLSDDDYDDDADFFGNRLRRRHGSAGAFGPRLGAGLCLRLGAWGPISLLAPRLLDHCSVP